MVLHGLQWALWASAPFYFILLAMPSMVNAGGYALIDYMVHRSALLSETFITATR